MKAPLFCGGPFKESPPFFCGGPFKERSPTPLQTFLDNAHIGGYGILKLNGIRRGIRQVSIPAPMLCIGGEEKQKDIKKGNELPFLISFSFPGDLRSHTGMRELQLTKLRSPLFKVL